MKIAKRTIKIQLRVVKKLEQVKKLYGLQSLSHTIDYLIGNDKVVQLMGEQQEQELVEVPIKVEKLEKEGENYVISSNEPKDIH